MEVNKMCKIRDIKSKIRHAPNLEILREYALTWFDKCPEQLFNVNAMEQIKPTRRMKNGTTTKKRKPSKYNLFMKECIPKMKQEYPEVDHKNIFSMCASEYKNNKGE